MQRCARNTSFKALIVEGTHGVGKSTLVDGLIRTYVNGRGERKIRSFVHLAQSHTYGPLARAEDDGTLTVRQNVRHLERIADGLEWLQIGVAQHTSPHCVVIIDTLHLTHCFRPGVVQWPEVRAIDERLAAIGCKLLFLHASRETLWTRAIEASADSQFLREYARKFGQTNEELHEYFLREQSGLHELFERSNLEKLQIENDAAAVAAADRAFEFWTA